MVVDYHSHLISCTEVVRSAWIAKHGVPQTLLTNQGQQVDRVEMGNLHEKLIVEKNTQAQTIQKVMVCSENYKSNHGPMT